MDHHASENNLPKAFVMLKCFAGAGGGGCEEGRKSRTDYICSHWDRY